MKVKPYDPNADVHCANIGTARYLRTLYPSPEDWVIIENKRTAGGYILRHSPIKRAFNGGS